MSDTIDRTVGRHLEYLGYEVHDHPDGWSYAVHPVRLNMHVRACELGVRLHCMLWIGNHVANRPVWLEFVNRANDSATLARFDFGRDDEGAYHVRVRALLPATYKRRLFALLLDAWQEDLRLLRSAPREMPVEEDEGDEEEQAAAVVN